MSAGTFTLPDGSRVRTGSQRRYVRFTYSSTDGRWVVTKRSDSLVVLRRLGGSHSVIVDTHTGEAVR